MPEDATQMVHVGSRAPLVEHDDARPAANIQSAEGLSRKERRKIFWEQKVREGKENQQKKKKKNQEKKKKEKGEQNVMLGEMSRGDIPGGLPSDAGVTVAAGRDDRRGHGQGAIGGYSDGYSHVHVEVQPGGNTSMQAQRIPRPSLDLPVRGLDLDSSGQEAYGQAAVQPAHRHPLKPDHFGMSFCSVPIPSFFDTQSIEPPVYTHAQPSHDGRTDEQTQALEAHSPSAVSNAGTAIVSDNSRPPVARPLGLFPYLDLLSTCPPTTSTAGYRDFIKDLGPTVEQPRLQAAMPDPESSTRAPRIILNDWDAETKTAQSEPCRIVPVLDEVDEIIPYDPFAKRRDLMRKLLLADYGCVVPMLRSQTSPPSFDASSVSWTDCSTTVVEVQQELTPKHGSVGDVPLPSDIEKRAERFLGADHYDSREEWVYMEH